MHATYSILCKQGRAGSQRLCVMIFLEQRAQSFFFLEPRWKCWFLFLMDSWRNVIKPWSSPHPCSHLKKGPQSLELLWHLLTHFFALGTSYEKLEHTVYVAVCAFLGISSFTAFLKIRKVISLWLFRWERHWQVSKQFMLVMLWQRLFMTECLPG